MEPQPGIWSVENDNFIDPSSNQIAVANGTSTGVLPQYELILKSSVSCERIEFEQMPGICPGLRPFTTRFQADHDPTEQLEGNASDFDLQVCVPGSFVDSLWTLSRDAQTIFEEMFFGLNVSARQRYGEGDTAPCWIAWQGPGAVLQQLDGRIGIDVRPSGDGNEVLQLIHGGSAPLSLPTRAQVRKRKRAAQISSFRRRKQGGVGRA